MSNIQQGISNVQVGCCLGLGFLMQRRVVYWVNGRRRTKNKKRCNQPSAAAYLYLKGNKQMKIASFLAMTTILIAHGRKEGRQHKNGRHCEEERRGNLPYFFMRSTGYTHIKK